MNVPTAVSLRSAVVIHLLLLLILLFVVDEALEDIGEGGIDRI